MTTTNKRLSMTLNPTLAIMIEDLRKVRGDSNNTETIKEAIRFYHSKKFPVYASANTKPDNEQVIRSKVVLGAVKQDVKTKEAESICAQLGGVVNGNTCSYFKYDERDRYSQEVPLSLLSADLVQSQYVPNREEVQEYKRKGLANY